MEPNYANLDNDRLYGAAAWFAGYAVMRWHLGYELGDLMINQDGTGEWQPPAHPTEYDPERLPPHVQHGIELFELGPAAPTLEDGEQLITPDMTRDILEDGRRIFLHVPTPHHHALMHLACWYWEYWFSLPLPENPLEWPERCLEQVWQWLTFEYCLTAFDRPMTCEEALILCVDEVKRLHEQYAYLEEGLIEELCARLTVSGEEMTAYLSEWRDATEFGERNQAFTEAGGILIGARISCKS